MNSSSTAVAQQPSKIDRSNWRQWPHSRWAFHNVKEIVPSVTISSAGGAELASATEAPSFDDFRLPMEDGTEMDFVRFLEETSTDAMIILRRGEIILEKYADDVSSRSQHILMSGTKSVVGLIVGVLHARGELDPKALVSQFVPEISDTGYRHATVRHLLDMRAGIVFDQDELASYEAATNWHLPDRERASPTLHSFLEKTRAVGSKPHGGAFSYVSANTDLLGWVIERATGRQFAELVSELLWQPMGAEEDAYITIDTVGNARTTGGLCATARDFARVGQLIANSGRRGKIEVIPSDWIDDIVANGDRKAWRTGEFAAFGMDMSYRSGWYSVHQDPKVLFAMGTHGQNLFVDIANDVVIAKLSSQAVPLDFRAMALTHRAVGVIRTLLSR